VNFRRSESVHSRVWGGRVLYCAQSVNVAHTNKLIPKDAPEDPAIIASRSPPPLCCSVLPLSSTLSLLSFILSLKFKWDHSLLPLFLFLLLPEKLSFSFPFHAFVSLSCLCSSLLILNSLWPRVARSYTPQNDEGRGVED